MASCMRASTMLRNSLPRMTKEGDSASCHERRAHDWESGREPGAGGERRGGSDERGHFVMQGREGMGRGGGGEGGVQEKREQRRGVGGASSQPHAPP